MAIHNSELGPFQNVELFMYQSNANEAKNNRFFSFALDSVHEKSTFETGLRYSNSFFCPLH